MKRFIQSSLYCFILVFTLSLHACSKSSASMMQANLAPQVVSQVTQPVQEVYKIIEEKSSITINYSITNKSVTDTFQFVVDSVFKEDWYLEDYKVRSKLKRKGPMKVEFSKKDILVELPLSIEVIKETFLGNVSVKGSTIMKFVSNIDIDSTWTLKTKTKLVSNEWTEKPTLSVGVNLPIEPIADRVMDRIKPMIETGIDQSIRESFNLRSMILEVNKQYSTPYQMHEVFGGWFYMVTDSTYLTPLTNKVGVSSGKIKLTTKTIASSEKPSKLIFPKIPKVAWINSIPDNSKLVLQMDLAYPYLDSIANAEIAGKTFEEGGKKITVHRVRISPLGQKLQIAIQVSGDVDGEIIASGIPIYDKSISTIMIKEIDFAFRTMNILQKAAAWLLKGKIKSELDKATQFPINDKIKLAQTQLDKTIDQYYNPYNMQVTAKLGEPDITLFYPMAEKLTATIVIDAYIHALFKDLSFFR
jgi:hypothetical protein